MKAKFHLEITYNFKGVFQPHWLKNAQPIGRQGQIIGQRPFPPALGLQNGPASGRAHSATKSQPFSCANHFCLPAIVPRP